jgi:probable phosphoglycerate mutase
MNPRVLLCRHGNTFAAGEKVVMIGAREDLPLTPEGAMQGSALGKVLRERNFQVSRVCSGPLIRTKVFAECIVAELGGSVPISIDARLTELDYGAWSGLSDDEIKAAYGEETLLRWQEASQRPAGIDFQPSAEQVRADVEAFLTECASVSGVSLIVSSNGRLREFGRLCSGEINRAISFKMRTGSASLLQYSGGRWAIHGWDLRPRELHDVL